MNLTTEQIFQAALQYFQAGKLLEAEQLCQQMLQIEPDNADANHFIGVITAELGGKDDLAIRYIEKAIQVKWTRPLVVTSGQFHYNLILGKHT